MSVDTALATNYTLSERELLKDPSIGVNSSILAGGQSIEERWNHWFQTQPVLQEHPPSDDPFLQDYLQMTLPESDRESNRESNKESNENLYLRQAFFPVDSDLLKTAQVHILMQFQGFLHSSNDANVLQSLLHNRLFCTLSGDFVDLVPVCTQTILFIHRYHPMLVTSFVLFSFSFTPFSLSISIQSIRDGKIR